MSLCAMSTSYEPVGEDPGQSDEKGPAARRRPRAAREAYSLYVERAAEGANAADGPLSSLYRSGNRAIGTIARYPASAILRLRSLAAVTRPESIGARRARRSAGNGRSAKVHS